MKRNRKCETCHESANVRLEDIAGNVIYTCQYHQHGYRPYYMTASELLTLDAQNAARQHAIDMVGVARG